MLEHAPNWHVVASIRVFDLKFGIIYRDLFKGPAVDDGYQNSEFVQVRHLSVPKLTDDELKQVWSKSQLMEDAYKQGTGTLRDLLRSPFNLWTGSWTVPDDAPTGPIRYTVTATDRFGRTATFSPFINHVSQFTVVE